MHMSTKLSSLQYIFSLYTFSQNCTVKQESLCNIPNGATHAQRGYVACQRHTAELEFLVFVVAAVLFLLHEHCLSPSLGLPNSASVRFAILLILFVALAPASGTVLAHSRCSTYIYSIHIGSY